jgi:Putative prokaryotic signal transducing protein
MIKVYSSENSMEVGLIKGMLEQEGIACLVKNQNLAGAMGEIPPLECWPELWITDDNDLPQAKKIVEAALSPMTESAAPWHCQCGEIVEAQFTDCWNCNQQRPDL